MVENMDCVWNCDIRCSQVLDGASEFGMTPSSRSKVSVLQEDKSNPFENFLNGG